ncbi:glycosyltransferase 87 family protein [Umezawaea tangerina]|uniref:2'-5' RNA ligase superfamily protein n=1 Tax=Umezawaea tangerina TaxID=84725 RepID=A0A2T0T7H5_9PSEU|nr:glycosyltransferase 87 family protein [Umezawaea tangerina]PRY41607.1 2'-5' RNA ligase superfamily protein [Umezawaea tangerina]
MSHRSTAIGSLAVVLAAAFAQAFVAGHLPIDLMVYRAGGQSWLAGLPLYSPDFPHPLDGPALPFTYPPFAAVLFSALTVLPVTATVALSTLASALALTAVCVLAARIARPGRGAALGLATAALGLYALEPVRETLSFGQVNLVLAALVAADCLVRAPRWPRGLLIGLAAAVKLTPAVFLLYFLAKREWRAAATAALGFVGCALVGVVLNTSDSAVYWLEVLGQPQRIGGLSYAANQSLRGALERVLGSSPTTTALWALSVVAVLAATWIGARRARAEGDDLTAVLVVAAGGLLASPVSWSHHWVWIAPALVLLGVRAWRSRKALAGTGVAVLVLVFCTGPFWLFARGGNRELGWSWWQHLVGDAYVWCGLALVVWVALRGRLSLTAPLRHCRHAPRRIVVQGRHMDTSTLPVRPVVVTLTVDEATQRRWDVLRRSHFPAHRLVVGAHLTLFHAIPGEHQDTALTDALAVAASTTAFPIVEDEPYSLGSGVALRVLSPRLHAVRTELATRWAGWLSRQDSQPFRPHVTVQNKVDPDHARRTLAQLRATGPSGWAGSATGISLWRYEGGPWAPIRTVLFT